MQPPPPMWLDSAAWRSRVDDDFMWRNVLDLGGADQAIRFGRDRKARWGESSQRARRVGGARLETDLGDK
jgi:hypothetical protein